MFISTRLHGCHSRCKRRARAKLVSILKTFFLNQKSFESYNGFVQNFVTMSRINQGLCTFSYVEFRPVCKCQYNILRLSFLGHSVYKYMHNHNAVNNQQLMKNYVEFWTIYLLVAMPIDPVESISNL